MATERQDQENVKQENLPQPAAVGSILLNTSMNSGPNPIVQPTPYSVMENIEEEVTPDGHAQRSNFIHSQTNTSWNKKLESYYYIIDFVILLLFYFLFLCTIVFAVCSVILTIIHFIQNPSDESAILKISEHIFLSLLPIFIVFGFFHYYQNNTQNSLIGNSFPRNDDGNSTKTMNLTKTLFLSSIISYVMIKVIELIFSKTDFDVWKILLSILLLTILMIYFVFVHKINHTDE